MTRPERRCPTCGTILTWNPHDICCRCEDKLDTQASTTGHRQKLLEDQYPLIVNLREAGWTWTEIGFMTGMTSNYLCHIIKKWKREHEATHPC